MWFKGCAGNNVKAAVSNLLARHFSRKAAVNLRKINPKVPPQEASVIANSLYDVIKQHGPVSISNAWIHAQEASVSGLNSKTHMKILLKWMQGRKMLKQFCTHVGTNKKFFLTTLPEDPQAVEEREASNLRLRTVRSSRKNKKHKKSKSK